MVHGSDEMVSLLMQKRYYPRMVVALARLIEAEAAGAALVADTAAAATAGAEVPWPTEGEEPSVDSVDWTDVQNCRRLRAHLKNPAALAMLDLTAEAPGERVYLDAVVERSGSTRDQAKSGLGALTKAIRVVFKSKGYWPARFTWDKERALAYYVMSPEVAAAWKAAGPAS
jgi:hypothetical protein